MSEGGQTLLATGGYDQVLRLWDTANWQELATLRGHEDEIWLLLSPLMANPLPPAA